MPAPRAPRPRRAKRDKSPAYQWYPKDALTDHAMMAMSNEVEGCYRRLLDHAWLEDGLPANPDLIFPLAKCATRRKFDQIWMTLDPLLPIGPDGKRRNPRQERERKGQQKFRKQMQLAAKKSWEKRHERGTSLAHATVYAWQCSSSALASASSIDPDRKEQESSASPRALLPPIGGTSRTPAMARMCLSVWEVRPHLLAAVHALVASGAPYVDADGQPVYLELIEQLKIIASRDLHAEWEGRELHAILDAALGRRASLIEAEVAADGFRRRERRTIQKLGRVR